MSNIRVNNLDELQLQNVEIVFFDFDGVFTDNHVWIDENGIESVKCFRSDGIGISNLKDCGIPIYIVSSETNKVVEKRAKKLKIPVSYGVINKKIIFDELCLKHKVSPKNALFVGNDINDIVGFKYVGFPVGVNDCFPEIEEHIIAKTKNSGGNGAVREVCDLISISKKSND